MSDQPRILIPHLVGFERATALRSALEPDVPPGAIDIATTAEETTSLVSEASVLVSSRVPAELLDAADGLEWVQTFTAGVDHLDIARMEREGIVLTNASGATAEPIAEQLLCYMLMFERRMPSLVRQQVEGVWYRQEGTEIRGKTLGVIGVGTIGTRLAELGSAVGMEVIGTKRDLETMPAVVDEPLPADDYPALLRRSDHVALTCGLTPETEELIGAPELRLMSSDAVLLNVARGEICDRDALYRALSQRNIRGAALDVHHEEPLPAESPFWDLPNVIVTPHMADSTPHKIDRWASLIAENYRRLRRGETDLRNRVV